MEPGRVDAGHRIARHNLTGRDVGGGIDHKLQRDWQLGQVDVIAFEHHVFPCAAPDDFAGNVFLAALAECGWQIGGFYAETCGQQLAIAGNIRDELHTAAAHVLEYDNRALAGVIELEHQCRGIETQLDRLTNAQQFVGKFGLDQPQETAQTLSIAVDISLHQYPLLGPRTCSSYTGVASTGSLRTQSSTAPEDWT